MKSIPILEDVRRWLSYEEETGNLIWNSRPRSDFNSDRGWNSFNTRFANKAAGTLTKDGYVNVKVADIVYRAHRIIVYLMTYKRWTDENGVEWESWEEWEEVDHDDCNPSNNAWANLRPASRSGNVRNTLLRIDNTSGLKDVIWHSQHGKWQVLLSTDKKRVYIGLFLDKWEANFYACFWRHVFHGKFASE